MFTCEGIQVHSEDLFKSFQVHSQHAQSQWDSYGNLEGEDVGEGVQCSLAGFKDFWAPRSLSLSPGNP